MARRVSVTARSEFSWGREAVPPEPPTGLMVEVEFGYTDNIAFPTGTFIVDDGTGPENFPVVQGIGDLVVAKTSMVPDGTLITITMLDDNSDPYCNAAGQSVSTSWPTNLVTDTCISGFIYTGETTADFAEAATGFMRFIPAA